MKISGKDHGDMTQNPTRCQGRTASTAGAVLAVPIYGIYDTRNNNNHHNNNYQDGTHLIKLSHFRAPLNIAKFLGSTPL